MEGQATLGSWLTEFLLSTRPDDNRRAGSLAALTLNQADSHTPESQTATTAVSLAPLQSWGRAGGLSGRAS
jgi:hypothetical protein